MNPRDLSRLRSVLTARREQLQATLSRVQQELRTTTTTHADAADQAVATYEKNTLHHQSDPARSAATGLRIFHSSSRVVQVHQIAGGRRILPAAEGGPGAKRLSQVLIGDDLQQRIVALTNESCWTRSSCRGSLRSAAQSRSSDEADRIEGPQRQKPGIAGDLAA